MQARGLAATFVRRIINKLSPRFHFPHPPFANLQTTRIGIFDSQSITLKPAKLKIILQIALYC